MRGGGAAFYKVLKVVKDIKVVGSLGTLRDFKVVKVIRDIKGFKDLNGLCERIVRNAAQTYRTASGMADCGGRSRRRDISRRCCFWVREVVRHFIKSLKTLRSLRSLGTLRALRTLTVCVSGLCAMRRRPIAQQAAWRIAAAEAGGGKFPAAVVWWREAFCEAHKKIRRSFRNDGRDTPCKSCYSSAATLSETSALTSR